ncbi:MAG TPA: hypothetical protein PLS69_11505 [Terricaulis sp.]|nr:hypothetical protein [Terricaulis sp.]HRP09410.1 hypothetical protein [Terricaulis sp.]
MSVKPKAEFWFARRYPLGSPRQAYAPVHWKGWMATLVFLAALLGGGAYFAWDALVEQNFVQGMAVFIVAAIVGTTWYLLVVRANSDTLHTVADYKKGKPRV